MEYFISSQQCCSRLCYTVSNGKSFERSCGMHLHSQAVQVNKRQLDPENESTMTLQSVAKYSTVDVASQPRTLESSG